MDRSGTAAGAGWHSIAHSSQQRDCSGKCVEDVRISSEAALGGREVGALFVQAGRPVLRRLCVAGPAVRAPQARERRSKAQFRRPSGARLHRSAGLYHPARMLHSRAAEKECYRG